MTQVTALTTTWVRELQDALGPDSVLTDPDVTAAYARDQAMLVSAGLPAAVALPRSTEEVSAVLRLASRHGITVVNAPGTVDAGYRGEVRVVLLNTDRHEPFTVRRGDRIAQLVVQPVTTVRFVDVEELPPTPRGEGGFGSTGR